RAWRLRMVDAAGARITWRRALLRFAAGLATLLPALAGAAWAAHSGRGPWWCWTLLAGLSYWWALPDPQHLCLHERLSGTRLVRSVPAGR
ncbi:MAG TPA: RDD family protein, partial [Gammaproteobacteria bacterium]|nr:RDD family protein [Gammaproteobacteria bacterium]